MLTDKRDPSSKFDVGSNRTVFWVIDDSSIIKELDLDLFYEEIRSRINPTRVEAYYFDGSSEQSVQIIRESPFVSHPLPKGNKNQKVYYMLMEILRWARRTIKKYGPTTLIVLSKNMIEEDKQVAPVLKALKDKGNYNVVFEDPSSLLDKCPFDPKPRSCGLCGCSVPAPSRIQI